MVSVATLDCRFSVLCCGSLPVREVYHLNQRTTKTVQTPVSLQSSWFDCTLFSGLSWDNVSDKGEPAPNRRRVCNCPGDSLQGWCVRVSEHRVFYVECALAIHYILILGHLVDHYHVHIDMDFSGYIE
ncbi:hypothetical protein ElyMa_003922600 [Elysia marginata]|uniref:SRCR domain-containing protein n=1 Tax=Elysia marginata TaxID=1093978 RepID=A0AAV4FRQ2_9GAST|nr:hypothetical protein ElyMa_003922600 [Elysia marginata]